jgi:hypothetical protein
MLLVQVYCKSHITQDLKCYRTVTIVLTAVKGFIQQVQRLKSIA